jgi:hypothetical protein
MDDMTQQNAALVEQAAAAAASLHEQTVNLARAVSIFRIEDGRDQAAAALDRRAPDSPLRGRPVLEHRTARGAAGTPRPRRAANG